MPALPPVREDKAVQGGYAAKQKYTARLREIRDDLDLSEFVKAEQLAKAHEKLLGELDRLRTDLHDRRTARLATLKAKVPLGAGVPADASPADKAVLNASFRTALERAREAGSPQARRTLLVDAQRYDDDTLRRGVLTAAFELNELDTVGDWVREHTNLYGREDFLQELRTLRGQLESTITIDRQWEMQALGVPRPPQEMANLPALRAQRDADLAQQRKSARFA
jgi:hypothetical protein